MLKLYWTERCSSQYKWFYSVQLSHHKKPIYTATISVNGLIGGLMFYCYCFLCQLIKFSFVKTCHDPLVKSEYYL